MKLRFHGIEVGPFKVFKEAQVFPMAKHGRGLHFLKGRNEVEPRLGSNGAGKSSLWDAMTWCLYGRTVRGLQGPDVKPWGSDHAKVGVVFSVDGKKHAVIRSVGPNALHLDGKDANQEKIDRLLGIDYDTFKHTVLMGQGMPLFFDLSPRDKMELLSTVLRLDRWEVRSERAAKKAKELGEKVASIEGEITAYEAQIENLLNMRAEAQFEADKWENHRADREAAAKKALKGYERSLDEAEIEAGKHDLRLDGSATEAKQLERDLEDYGNQLHDAESVVAQIGGRLLAFEKEAESKKEELAGLGEGSRCPTCGQSLVGTNLGAHRKRLRAEIAELEEKAQASIPERHEKAIDAARKKVRDAARHLQEFRNKESEARDALDRAYRKVADLKATVKIARNTVDTIADEKNPHAVQSLNYKKQIRELKLDKEDAEKELRLKRRRLERVKYWVKGFKDVRLYLLSEFMTELEVATNGMIDEFGLAGWEVRYSIERETRSGTIKRGLTVDIFKPKAEKPSRWESYSGGEGQRLRLISGLALSETLLRHAGINCDLEILDEPSRHLSAQGVRDLCDYLADRAAGMNKQIWLVDHQAIESSRFDTLTTIRRGKSGAKIEAE